MVGSGGIGLEVDCSGVCSGVVSIVEGYGVGVGVGCGGCWGGCLCCLSEECVDVLNGVCECVDDGGVELCGVDCCGCICEFVYCVVEVSCEV